MVTVMHDMLIGCGLRMHAACAGTMRHAVNPTFPTTPSLPGESSYCRKQSYSALLQRVQWDMRWVVRSWHCARSTYISAAYEQTNLLLSAAALGTYAVSIFVAITVCHRRATDLTPIKNTLAHSNLIL